MKEKATSPNLMKYVRKSGCASKISPGDLFNALCGLDIPQDENTIVGIEGYEDAGVYRITDDMALVQTIDFSTPTVNDPFTFGQIAAANALSDVYAMGGEPRTALNIVCFSIGFFDRQILKDILKGGAGKLKEAGVSLLGGHSVDDPETKYGISVTGLIHPGRVIRNTGAKPGDYLILTKPIGSGIVSTGIKEQVVDESMVQEMIISMTTLNKDASRVMCASRAHAATDVTGFGLIGHLKEMIQENVGVELFIPAIPVFSKAEELASAGVVPGGLLKNKAFYEQNTIGNPGTVMDMIIYDPQTSGGLMIAISPDDMGSFETNAQAAGLQFRTIGRFLDEPKGRIILRSHMPDRM